MKEKETARGDACPCGRSSILKAAAPKNSASPIDKRCGSCYISHMVSY
ncbi:hypothetical protein HMPREF1545_02093 [Oscillibacter sp. KLE 1728]|nr:hypothetical protein HMPREF1545_02093 [Oscillibacter sp. KLE 1728]